MSGAQVGQQIGGAVGGMVQNANQQEALRLAEERKNKLNGALARVADLNASGDDFATIVTSLDPAHVKDVMAAGTSLGQDKLKQRMNEAGQVMSALSNGDTQAALDTIDRNIAAHQAAGQDKDVAALQQTRAMVEKNPKLAYSSLGSTIAALPGGTEFLKTIYDTNAEQRTQAQFPDLMAQKNEELKQATSKTEIDAINAKYAEQVKNLDMAKTQAEIDKLNADAAKVKADKLIAEHPGLSPAAEANIVAASDKSVALRADAQRFNNWAAKIKSIPTPPGGTVAQVTEAVKKALGGQDQYSLLRAEYNSIRASDVMKNLPPGSASESDMKLVMSGWPEENQSPAVLANFVQSIARIKEYEAMVQEAKADWIGQVGNLTRTIDDTAINGAKVPKGTSYAEFISQHVKYPGNAAAGTQQVVTGSK